MPAPGESANDLVTSILAVIPARGQSKRIPRKNLCDVAGRPLIAWSIEEAKQVPEISRLIVSTDDEEIAQVSREWGAEVPFVRPPGLATDHATSFEVVDHALRWCTESGGRQPELVLLLQPTSPLRTAADIRGAIALQRRTGANGVVSVQHAEHRPWWFRTIASDGELQPWRGLTAANDDGQPLYLFNGCIYLVRSEVFLTERTFVPHTTQAFVMPAERSLDIDVPPDLKIADLLLRDRQAAATRPADAIGSRAQL